MKTYKVFALIAIFAIIISSCVKQPAVPTHDPLVVQQGKALVAIQTQLAQPTPMPFQPVEPTPTPVVVYVVVQPTPQSVVPANGLVNPVLHHAESNPPESGVGSFDVGVHADQIGIVFGWHIRWVKGGQNAGGEGCDLVLLTPGWYENLEILDGRFEVYTVPTTDYSGWVKVLAEQRANEQAMDYGCPTRMFENIPRWESTIPSPP